MPRAYDIRIRAADGKTVAGPFSLDKAEEFIRVWRHLGGYADFVIEEASYPRLGRDLQVSFKEDGDR
ncbi:MAG: hypothetical protein C5B60_05555 [Chloroflexi bacterium]|nr:MAG: hypothetical protein C5B60_05555 [Chloroflexota bacterium]